LRRLLLALLLSLSFPASAEAPRIAIIIDDLGYHLANGQRALQLPGTVSFSFLPGGPSTRTLARQAHELGRDILLHLPLQAYQDDHRAEPKEINIDMSRLRVGVVFDEALEAVPHVIGVNGHRGSLLTRHPGQMQSLMEKIRDQGNLFFIDSFTHHESVALQIARENGVPAIKRDVFLDPDRSRDTVAREFERMKKLAVERGQVVAIGHPHPETLDLLERQLPQLAEEGFELVNVRDLLP
jgi:polysaccharide deacetylase 2 family uncharacterized protein YibQ